MDELALMFDLCNCSSIIVQVGILTFINTMILVFLSMWDSM